MVLVTNEKEGEKKKINSKKCTQHCSVPCNRGLEQMACRERYANLKIESIKALLQSSNSVSWEDDF